MDKEVIKEILNVDIKFITNNGEEKTISLSDFDILDDNYISVQKNDVKYPRYKMDIHLEANKYVMKIQEKQMAKKEIDGVKVNDKSIIAALKIIKQVCEDNVENSCTNCPFSISDNDSLYCGINDLTPDNWKILEYKKFQALG